MYKTLRALSWLAISVLAWCAPAHSQTDLTTLVRADGDSIEVELSRSFFNRRSSETSLTVTLNNASGAALPLPVVLAVAELTPATVTVANAPETSLDGLPIYPLGAEGGSLAPGQSLSQSIVLATPGRERYDFTPMAFIAPAPPALPEVAIESPASGLLINAMEAEVAGTAGAGVASVGVNDVPATLSGGTFTATVPLREGSNTLTAVARTAAGGVGSASVTVIRDTTPPRVAVESPAAGQIVPTPAVMVAGNVNDVVTGTVNEANCQVTVSGRAGTRVAAVSNRTFMVEGFPLVPGPNTLTVSARDAAGNESAPVSVQITRKELVGQRVEVLSGDDQTGLINQALPQPVVVQAVDSLGNPLPGRALQARVTRNDGRVRLPGGGPAEAQITVTTDAAGQAAVEWRLGTRVGVANNRLEISGTGFAVPAQASASAVAGPCEQVLAMSGNNQVGIVGTALARPLEVVAFDAGGNFCAGTPITFRVEQGGGGFAGAPETTIATNSDGRAAAALTLGPDPGVNNHVVTTTFPGFTGQGATFLATAAEPVAAAATRFVGTVLDTENEPIPNARVLLEDADPPVEAFTDESGQFVLDDPPLGSGLLFVDGSTTTRPGRWPTLEFQIDVLAGIDNSLGMPIFLPELDSGNFRLVGGDQDVVLGMAGVEGFSLKIFANSVTFPDGSTTGLMGVTQVSNDQVPMPPTGGAAPPWVGTLQPANVHLDPPAQLTVPNSLGLPPGQIVEMFSFDHTLQQFVSVGTGTVQPDGATIVSDPGSGITRSGWFFDCPPPPPPAEAEHDPCQDSADATSKRADELAQSNPNAVPFARIQACIGRGVCSQAKDGGFQDNEWASRVVPKFIRRFLDETGDWPEILERCSDPSGTHALIVPSDFIAENWCARIMAEQHIQEDLGAAMMQLGDEFGDPRRGCARSDEDWSMIFDQVLACVPEGNLASDPFGVIDGFIRDQINNLRESVRADCQRKAVQ